MKFIKRLFNYLRLVASISLVAIILINLKVNSSRNIYSFSEIEKAPNAEVALVLGAKVYNDGRLSDMLRDRADTAVDLYNAGKVTKILMSGDHGTPEYDEVNTAKDYLLAQGVKGEDIFLDHAGFDTYDSLYRAKEIFRARSVAIISQNFHLPRAVYIGQGLGLEAYGVSADRHFYGSTDNNMVREIFADVKAFLDVKLSAKSRFLGPAIPLSGDSKKSWD